MDPNQIEQLIDRKIRAHEIRVAIASGIFGGLLFAGVFHAIYLNHIS